MSAPSASKKLFARLLIVAVLIAVVWTVRSCQRQAVQVHPVPAPTETRGGQTASPDAVPGYALEVLNYIRRNGQAPAGFVGGREFQNREKKLPAKSPDGSRIRYSEWDVHPKETGKNRGPERLVTGSDHSAWYTKDHYKTFRKID